MAMLMDDDMIEAIVSMLIRLQDEESTDLPIFEKQLRETETAIDNIITAIMGGISSKALQTKLAQLEAAKEEILIRIDEEKLEKPKISADFMTFWLHKFRKLDVTKEAHRQMLIDTFVNAVFLYDRRAGPCPGPDPPGDSPSGWPRPGPLCRGGLVPRCLRDPHRRSAHPH